MNSEIRFPTILGLAVLTVGLSLGVFLITKQQTFQSQASVEQTPKEIVTAGISSTSASIHWQTDQAVGAFIKAGVEGDSTLPLTFADVRDSSGPVAHTLHFVSLSNLTPNTNYQFKIYSGAAVFPQKEFLKFKTAPDLGSFATSPLRGTILTSQLQPVDEALITLEIPGVQKLATITKVAGNFVLPLSDVYNESLSEKVDLSKLSVSAKMTVYNRSLKSEITLILPLPTESLEQIILGQDRDFTTSQKPLPSEAPGALKYDLDGDHLLTSLDFSIVLVNLGKNPKDKRADLNGDGVVDEADLDLIRSYLPKSASPLPTPKPSVKPAADG